MAQDSCIIIPSQQPQPLVEAITFMDCDLLKAAEDGDMELFNREIPLHIAARHGHYKNVKFLIERAKTWRIRKQVDKADNTAFHMAVECPLDDIDVELELDPEFSLSANKSGETPLYIAAMTSYDKKGRTPFHYAAHFGSYSAVEQLLEMNASAAYVRDKERDDGMTELHMAAWVGNANIMQHIISHCPASCEIVDERGWNFLHYAAVALKERISYAFTGQRCDTEGSKNQWPIRIPIKKIKIGNNAGVEGIRPHKSFRENMGKDNNPSTLKEVVDKLRETHLLMAALVATVAFTAAIAVPGGTAILSHNSAFKTFVMTNAMPFSFTFSASSFSLVLKCILVTDGLTVFTMAAMVVSSRAGSNAVLEPSIGIAIATCSIGLTFPFSLILPFLIYYFFKRNY
ncbi:hypothetical protein GOBAR_AA38226 [Gossypium barbadense]|uniref:PGG domain-containing protein n=1 Tax=Gossypium barbadense TaxID=3634 RepID=A0A2P5VUJ9_GOSBA|nr:hypothetical protein GOBAR_AA38226 [Gossypium barbadense]